MRSLVAEAFAHPASSPLDEDGALMLHNGEKVRNFIEDMKGRLREGTGPDEIWFEVPFRPDQNGVYVTHSEDYLLLLRLAIDHTIRAAGNSTTPAHTQWLAEKSYWHEVGHGSILEETEGVMPVYAVGFYVFSEAGERWVNYQPYIHTVGKFNLVTLLRMLAGPLLSLDPWTIQMYDIDLSPTEKNIVQSLGRFIPQVAGFDDEGYLEFERS